MKPDRPSVDVVMRARDQPLELAGPHSQNGRAPPYPTKSYYNASNQPQSTLGDISGLEIQAAINLAKERVEWKKNRPSTLL